MLQEPKRASAFIFSARLVDRDIDAPGALLIRNGKIADVYTGENLAAVQAALASAKDEGIDAVDAGGAVLTPALADLHARFREPGFPQKEAMGTGATAAAAEDGNDAANSAIMLKAMKACAAAGLIFYCRCEDAALAEEAAAVKKKGGFGEAARLFRLSEDISTERNLLLAEEARCRIHVAGVSTKGALDAVRRAKARRPGLVTCEAAPHHLCLNDTLGAALAAAVTPPLRPEEDRLALVEGLKDGTIDAIAASRAPHIIEENEMRAPGFSGLQAAFSLCFTELVMKGAISLNRLSELMAAAPASILSIPSGLLKTGYEGDVALIDLQSSFNVNLASIERQGKGAGRTLCGQVLFAWRKGAAVCSPRSRKTIMRE